MREGRAHAALVFDSETALGWCEYGTPEELPGIVHRKEVGSAGAPLPDYRRTCFFVDRRYRGKGVATAALDGALKLITDAGGGVAEAYPQDTGGNEVADQDASASRLGAMVTRDRHPQTHGGPRI